MASNVDVITQAKMRLNAGSPGNFWQDYEIEIGACLSQALSEFSHDILEDAYHRSLLQQTYSVTLDGSGVGDVLAATGSVTGVAGEVMNEGILVGTVEDATGEVLQPLMSYQAFISPQAPVFGYYHLSGRKILTRAKGVSVSLPADIQGATGPLTIVANFTPNDCASVPGEIVNDLVETLCRVAMAKIKPQEQVNT